MMTTEDLKAFVERHTHLAPVPLVPEIRLYLGTDPLALWQVTLSAGASVAGAGSSLPYWSVAWPGGQALARYLLDHPDVVRGKTVLDLATGSGLVAIAAAKSGALKVLAVDLDPLAVAAACLNVRASGLHVMVAVQDIAETIEQPADVVLVGDAFYERDVAEHMMTSLDAAARRAMVLVGDPGRMYLPRERFRIEAEYDVPDAGAVEAAEIKRTAVWRMRQNAVMSPE